MIPTPRQLDIPHDEWRPGQFEAVRAIQNSNKKVTLIDAPTGSGKTAIGLALGASGRSVRALTYTRALQAQYGNYPNVNVLYGLNAYSCHHLQDMFNADSCVFPHDMLGCPSAAIGLCDYVKQRELTKLSPRQALSYPYFFNATWIHKPDGVVDHLYGDEAHHIPSAIMSHMTFQVDPPTLSKLRVPRIPTMPEPQSARKFIVMSWLESVIDELFDEIEYLTNIKEKNRTQVYKLKTLSSFSEKCKLMLGGMTNDPDDFYIELTDEGVLRIFPLTPAPFFWNLFNVHEDTHITLASATIGNHKEFAQLLGLGKGNWDSHIVPPVYPPESQPVFYYEDAPRMSHGSSQAAYGKQLELMKGIIDEFPDDADGLIHFVSIKTARRFADLLSFKYGDRVWMPDVLHSTEQKLQAWEYQKKKRPGTICLAWSFHTGVDSPSVVFNIAQKVPFMALDTQGQALMDRNKRLYGWFAGITLEQSMGRNRRGEPEHYEEVGQQKRKHNAILDNNFRIVKKYFSDHFNNCLVKV